MRKHSSLEPLSKALNALFLGTYDEHVSEQLRIVFESAKLNVVS